MFTPNYLTRMEKEMTAHFSIDREPGRLCTQGRKESHATEVT